MPQAVIPFTPSFKSFVITVIVLVSVLRLLFVVSHVPFRRVLLWERITAGLKNMKLDRPISLRFPLTLEYGGSLLALRRGRGNDVDSRTTSAEMYVIV